MGASLGAMCHTTIGLNQERYRRLMACIEGKLANFPPLKWKKQSSVCVVMAAGGYPDKVDTGQFITGIGKAAASMIIGIVILIITAIFWVLGAFGLVTVFLLGWLSLIIMLINPASPANIVVAAEVWGIFAGIAEKKQARDRLPEKAFQY